MKVTTIARVAHDRWRGQGIRQSYWSAAALAREVARLRKRENRAFAAMVLRDQWRYLAGARLRVRGEIALRIRAAVQWLLHARRATPDDGVPVGFFPCNETYDGWLPSYPETTGYIVTTLLAYSEHFGDPCARQAALEMAEWEIEIQMPSGAVQGGPVCVPAQQTAAAFNTGMVLDGWCSAFAATGERPFLDAARRAAVFLAQDIDGRGYFRTNGAYVSGGEIKTYTCLCAWALYRFGALSGESRYRDLATKVVDAALAQQQPNGWFSHNCLTRSEAPLTHTIGYTLQGVLEVGLLTHRERYIAAVIRSVDALCARVDRRGLLPARFYRDWKPASLSSCLTGNAQVAIICYRLYEAKGVSAYKEVADALVDSLKSLQAIDTSSPQLKGAIPGSFPLFGEYMRGGYPNWATKYFIDALMLQDRTNCMQPAAAAMRLAQTSGGLYGAAR